MNTGLKLFIVALLTAAVAAVVVLKQPSQSRAEATAASSGPGQAAAAAPASAAAVPKTALPRLVDLGAGKCIPCKLMAPILEELKKEYAGRFEVQFIDVWENPDAGKQYGVEMIPTQIFYDAGGKELFRHVGFFGKEDILAQWKALGTDLDSGTAPGLVREEPVRADALPRDQAP